LGVDKFTNNLFISFILENGSKYYRNIACLFYQFERSTVSKTAWVIMSSHADVSLLFTYNLGYYRGCPGTRPITAGIQGLGSEVVCSIFLQIKEYLKIFEGKATFLRCRAPPEKPVLSRASPMARDKKRRQF
jgi:hypothetical protein